MLLKFRFLALWPAFCCVAVQLKNCSLLSSWDGTHAWFLPAASPNASDVDVLAPDITAGASVVHLTTNLVVDGPLRAQHAQIRASRGGNCSRHGNAGSADSGLEAGRAAAAARAPPAPSSAAATSAGLGSLALCIVD
ncbi:hypothetical protein COO60DRAFT_1462487 [Scenedesmus sp. NREL 46B-D3]|nr:hypothetical protein COO60DRAFT_1462487 [Scenedesmus sp. NREL 46B-D3]